MINLNPRIHRNVVITMLLLVFSLSSMAYSFDAGSDKFMIKPYKKMEAVKGELIVKFRSAPDAQDQAMSSFSGDSPSSVISRAKVKRVYTGGGKRKSAFSTLSDRIDGAGVYKLTFDRNEDMYEVQNKLLQDPSVEYVEPNYQYQISVVPNDPSYRYQWGLQKIGAPSAWDVQKGNSSIVIAIIDTGVDYNHQDLSSNIWINEDEIPGNGIDDDNNGYIDDVRGWDFVNIPSEWLYPGEEGDEEDNDPMDFLGHGTHVAGIAAGVTDNGLGSAGTSWNSRIMCLRAGYLAFDGYGYLDLVDAMEGIYYAADNGADIISMSWGSLYDSVLISDAIKYAYSKGCFMTAAAGNVDSYDAQKRFYPAAYDHVVAVAATDAYDKISIWNFFAFSNFGGFVDISAPGTSILSSIPGNRYSYESGTSMATPFVAGAAALVKSRHPDWTAEQIEDHLKGTSDDIYVINQPFFTGKLGAGRLNVQKALGNLKMAITYPRSDSILNNSTVVKGTANMENFKEYKVECSTSPDSADWSLVGSVHSQPVENGVLEIWNVTNPDGKYYLKLTVTNLSGESFSSVSGINFGVLGEVTLSSAPKSGPNPFDPDAQNYLFYYDLNNAADVDICVYDMSGTMVWKKIESSNAGVNRVWWNGVDGFGAKIGNGVYIYMIVATDKGTRKIIGRGKIAVVRS